MSGFQDITKINRLTDSGLKILQEKARQSVAPIEELNNLRSAPGDMGSLEACETNVIEKTNAGPKKVSESVECQEKSETKILILQKWEIVKELPSYERPPIPRIKHDHQAKIYPPQACQ